MSNSDKIARENATLSLMIVVALIAFLMVAIGGVL